MLSHINRICGRPHRPRDEPIRKLCHVAGVTWPDASEDDQGHQQESEESDYDSDEESESEDVEGSEPGTSM